MSDDYKQGFKDGFQAGVDAAMKANIPQRHYLPAPSPATVPYPYQTPYPGYKYSPTGSIECIVCGMVFESGKAYGYACNNARCPTKVTSHAQNYGQNSTVG